MITLIDSVHIINKTLTLVPPTTNVRTVKLWWSNQKVHHIK